MVCSLNNERRKKDKLHLIIEGQCQKVYEQSNLNGDFYRDAVEPLTNM